MHTESRKSHPKSRTNFRRKCLNFQRSQTFKIAHMDTRLMIAPVAVSCGADAEFCDLEGLRARFGIKRSLAYQLLKDGAIRGVSLRRRGQVRGKRLFDAASVREFLRQNMEEEAK
jgi:hypothetical protein